MLPQAFPASAFGTPAAVPRDPLAGLAGLPATGRLDVVCVRPIHHALAYAALYRLTAALREHRPELTVRLHVRSALRDDAPFRALPADAVTRWGEDRGRGTLAAGLRRLIRGCEPGAAALMLAPPHGWRRAATGALLTAPLDFRTPGEDAAGQRFLAALERETPLWRVAAGAPPPLDRHVAGRRFLIHQARFHIGDTLWLTPLLRALHEQFPRPHVTLVAPPHAATVLAGNPHVDEIVTYPPGEGDEEKRRVLSSLAGRSFDAALLAFARRSESRWLAQAMASAGVPRRVNLEYHDGFLDSGRPWEAATHEAWFFWGTLPSPRLLLHALAPLLPPSADLPMDAVLEVRVSPEAQRQADALLAERGLAGRPFAVLAPGGLSSTRWPAARFAALAATLADELGLAILLEGSPEEASLLGQIAEQADHPSVLAAPDPLALFPAVLTRARLLVANDSAPLHFAAALGVPALYFAQREKLVHSHPGSTDCWALYDDVENDLTNISPEQALGAVREMIRRGVVRVE
jgi:ADP-heptose:LPS heptosyltransferase